MTAVEDRVIPPPPPPPAPRRRTRRGLGEWAGRQPLRYQAVAVAGCVIVATIGFARMFVHPVDERAIADTAARAATQAVGGQLAEARATSTQIAVPQPFSWARCPMSTEARVMIGGDPATGGKTLNAKRAAPLEEQAQVLLAAFPMTAMRLSAPTQATLRVTADDPTVGVPLFVCDGSTPTAPPTSAG